MSCWTCVVTVYAIGFLVTPFFWSLLDGWPFAKPRIDGCTGGTIFFFALAWPLVFVSCGLYGWWALCSAAGTKAHEAIKRKIGRMARDGTPSGSAGTKADRRGNGK